MTMRVFRNAPRGFTLVEVLVTTVLVAVAIVGVLGGIRAIRDADAKAQTADLLQRLASEKINDLRLLQDPATGGTDGDFTDRGYPDVSWALQETASGVTDLTQITVTVTRDANSQALTTLLFVRPQAETTTSAPGTATGAGA